MKNKNTILLFCAVFFVFILFSMTTGISVCVQYQALGVPCPACGMTRAWAYALSGDLRQAFYFHPLFLLALLTPLPFIPIKGKPFSREARNNFFIMLIVILIGVWIYRMAAYFPADPPMDFNESSLVGRMLKEVYLHGQKQVAG